MSKADILVGCNVSSNSFEFQKRMKPNNKVRQQNKQKKQEVIKEYLKTFQVQ